jgi:bifunctional non-homologous end joining protein LigD
MPWRTGLSRRRRLPAGFIAPGLPVLDDQIPTGPEWIHELKWDGYRIVAIRRPRRLWSRNARDWSATFPQIVAAIGQLPVESVILDGEAVCIREDGRPDFNRLRSKEGCAEARFIAFDLLELDGQDLRALPLYERREKLTSREPRSPCGTQSKWRERTARRCSAMPAGWAPRGSFRSAVTSPTSRDASSGGERSSALTIGVSH